MCGGLNEHGFHRHIDLRAWSTIGELFGRIRRGILVGGGVSSGVGSEVSKAHMSCPWGPLCLSACGLECKTLSYGPISVPATMLPTTMITYLIMD